MSDLSPLCAPKRTSADHSKFMGSPANSSIFSVASPQAFHCSTDNHVECEFCQRFSRLVLNSPALAGEAFACFA